MPVYLLNISMRSTKKTGQSLTYPKPKNLCYQSSDVLGWASSPEPAELSLFKPKPGWTLTRACSWAWAWLQNLKAEHKSG